MNEDFAMNYQQIAWAVEDGLLTITLARPERLNAFTDQMAIELIDAFAASRVAWWRIDRPSRSH